MEGFEAAVATVVGVGGFRPPQQGAAAGDGIVAENGAVVVGIFFCNGEMGRVFPRAERRGRMEIVGCDHLSREPGTNLEWQEVVTNFGIRLPG